jgi:hypothetical protein
MKAGEREMRSYTRFRKGFGAAGVAHPWPLAVSIAMLASLLVELSPLGEAQRTVPAENDATLFQNVVGSVENLNELRFPRLAPIRVQIHDQIMGNGLGFQ